ncbi:MAG: acyl-ACP--UDP-N-acetylglucosamine O-acyltransferase [Bryobacterales bacterium]|nr:acyl-ACP--UDP-N-acetylglucosamine O-acyltransferase [Bryobacterales bacterium]
MAIHPTAIIDPQARIASSAEIGPYCIIGAEVEIGERTRLMANIYAEGPTRIGDDNLFYPYTTVGVASQDLKYRGERAETVIGHRNKIREFVTIHRGTDAGGLVTSIGDDNLIMAYSHIAHDVHIGSRCVLANGATCGGHVTIGDWVVIGAFTGLHQFCRVGRHAIIGGYSVITQDVMPFSNTTTPRESKSYGANKTGLDRRGFSPETVDAINKALRLLTRAKLNTSQAIERIRAELPPCAEIEELITFIQSSERGVIK